jgi:hypothetical protein
MASTQAQGIIQVQDEALRPVSETASTCSSSSSAPNGLQQQVCKLVFYKGNPSLERRPSSPYIVVGAKLHIEMKGSPALSRREPEGKEKLVCSAIHLVLSSLLYARPGMVVEAFPLASVSLRRSHDVTVRGEWLSMLGCLLSWSWPRCPNLSWLGQGHWMRPI